MSHRKTLTSLYWQAINSLNAAHLIKKTLVHHENNIKIQKDSYDLDKAGELHLFSVGKAGLQMARAVEENMGDRIDGGVAISHEEGACITLQHYTATHPLVSQKSIDACEKLLEALQTLHEDDFYIFCLSGGASAMIEKPIEGLNLDAFQKISSALLVSGIDIKALNTVRKAISQIKGGKLAAYTKAKGVVLVLSDVLGDDLATIGSGPMYDGNTPHYIIGNNTVALNAAYNFILPSVQYAHIVSTTLSGTSEDAASFVMASIREHTLKYDSFCLLFGGETMTEVIGNGQGGRNQELALRLLIHGAISDNTSILVAGSDGIDGNSPATGAFLDQEMLLKMHDIGVDPHSYLSRSDSYGFFKALGADLETGPTGTNVMDFIFILKTQ